MSFVWLWLAVTLTSISTVLSASADGSGSASANGVFPDPIVSLISPGTPLIAGTNQSLLCSVNSSPVPVIFSWMRNGIPVNTSDSRVTVNNISQSTSTLMFSPLYTSDGAQYQCIVITSTNNITDEIDINVTVSIDIVTLSTIPNDTLYEYTFIDILCNVTVSEYVDTSTTIMYQWLMGSTLLTTGEDYNITGDTLRINQLSRSRDNGKTITCKATLIPSSKYQYVLENTVNGSVQLTVLALSSAKILHQLIIPDVPTAGDNFTITCRLDGAVDRLAVTPIVMLNFTYPHGGVSNELIQDGLLYNRKQSFNPGKTSDAGNYTCLATIIIGNKTLINIAHGLLKMQIPSPMIFVKLATAESTNSANNSLSHSYLAGSSLNITCNIDIPLSINTTFNVIMEWTRDYDDIMASGSGNESDGTSGNDRRVKIAKTTETASRHYQTQLVFSTLSSSLDSGNYMCSVTIDSVVSLLYVKDSSMVSETTTVNVKDPTITNTTVTSAVTVLESACFDSDLHDDFSLVCRAKKPAIVIPQLVVQWQHNGSVRTGDVSDSDNGEYVVNTLNVSDVQVSDAGWYTCTASIVIPESPKVATLIGNTTVTIRARSTPNMPVVINTIVTPTNATVTITIAKVAYTREIYYILYSEEEEEEDITKEHSHTVISKADLTATNSSYPILLSDLEEGTTYNYTVTASNCIGNTTTATMSFRTLCVHSTVQVSLDSLGSPLIAGTNRSLLCVFNSSAVPVNITWMKNGSPVNTSDSRVTVNSISQSTSTLMFSPLHTSDGAQYQCIVITSTNNITDEIDINVTVSIDIVTLSTIPNDTLYEYTFIDILCNVTVSEYVDTSTTIMYQWLTGSTLLTTGEDYNITGDTLRINQLSRSRDNGKTITCKATLIPSSKYQYMLHNTVNGSVQLTVLALSSAKILHQLIIPDVPTAGENFTITCRLHGAVDRLAVTPIVLLNFTYPHGGVSNKLIQDGLLYTRKQSFNPGNTSDAGNYTCLATIVIGNKTLINIVHGLLEMQIPTPVISVKLATAESTNSANSSLSHGYLAGSSLNITCSIDIPLSIDTTFSVIMEWTRDYDDIMASGSGSESDGTSGNGDDDRRVKIAKTTETTPRHYQTQLVFGTLSSSLDSGNYMCSVTIDSENSLLYVKDSSMVSEITAVNVQDPTITNTTVTSAVTVLESACLDSDLHDDFTLVCRAKKPAVVIPQLVVQWQHNGSVRTGNVSVSDTSGAYVVNTLNVSDVQVSDAGLYTCTASIVIPESPKVASLIGNTTVTIRARSIPNMPVITDTMVTSTNATVTITIGKIAYTRELYYILYSDQKEDITKENSHTVISKADLTTTNSSYPILLSDLEEDTTYNYTVTASNCIGNTTTATMSFRTLRVHSTVQVSLDSLGSPLIAGTNRSLLCVFNSSAVPVNITWLKNGSPVNTSDSRVTVNNISQGTSTLMFSALYTSDGAQYQCIVTVVSNGSVINLTDKIDFHVTSNSSNVTIESITNFTLYEYTFGDFVCSTTISQYVDTPITITYQWLMESTLLMTGEDYNITGDTLHINQLNKSHKIITCKSILIPSPDYQYVLQNTVSKNIQLTVEPLNDTVFTPLVIIPNDLTAGDNFNITCQLNGVVERLAETPLVSLTFSDSPNGTQGELIQNGLTYIRQLIFNPGITDNAGSYKCHSVVCVASGSTNYSAQATGILKIKIPPPQLILTINPYNITMLYEGTPVNLTCTAAIDTNVINTNISMSTIWIAPNGDQLTSTLNDRITIMDMPQSAPYTSVLVFDPADDIDTGDYQCNVTVTQDNSQPLVLPSSTNATTNLNFTVLHPPTVMNTIAGNTYLGSSLTLICKVDVIERLVVQPSILWTKQAVGSNNTLNSISKNVVKTNNTLTLTLNSIKTADAGQYTCTAIVNISTIDLIVTANSSTEVVLQISDPIVSVSTQPLLFEGKNGIITCTIIVGNTVNTPIAINTLWSGPSGSIRSNSDYTISSVVKVNATTYTSTLLLSEVLLGRDNGSSYSCTALLFSTSDPVHILSSNNSNEVTIYIDIVKAVPSDIMLHLPSDISFVEKGTLTLSCSSYSYPPPLLHWERRNNVLVSINRITVTAVSFPYIENSTRVNSTLKIQGLFPIDEGSYVCVASNEKGTKRASTSEIDVQEINDCSVSVCGSNGMCIDGIDSFSCICDENYFGVPCKTEKQEVDYTITITQSPQSVRAELYDKVNLTCDATSEVPIMYEWIKDGQMLSGHVSNSLIIPEINPEDRGVYRCIASNTNDRKLSKSALVTIRGVNQYTVYMNLTQFSDESKISDALLGPIPMSNVTVLAVKVLNDSSQDAISKNTLLVTIWNSDMTNFQLELQEILLMQHKLHVIGVVIYDSCHSQVIPIVNQSSITVSWSETEISQQSHQPCPCQNLTQQYGNVITRLCGGSYSQGAVWENMDYSKCGLTSRSIELCEALLKPPEFLSELLLNVTSTPNTLVSSEVTVASVIIDRLTSNAATNSEIRENYLETISNIIEVDQETIVQSNASARILSSLTRFGDEVVFNSSEEKQVFTRENFVIQIQEIDPATFAGESFNVDLGTVEEAMNSSGKIDPKALLTLLNPLSNATGSLSVSDKVVKNSNSSNIRLGYSVFVSSSLFPTASENTTVASIILNLRLRNFNTSTEIIDDLFNVTFKAIDTPVNKTIDNETCADWTVTGGLGRWNSNHCTVVTKPGERPVMCSCVQPAYFGLLFDLSPSQPIHPESLTIITYVGLSLSIIGLLVIIITYLTNKNLRTQDHNQIIINLSISLLGLYVIFLISGHVTEIKILCGISAGLLHYFMLVFFSWTAVESVFLFVKLVKVVGGGISKYNLKAGLFAWIVPALIVIISGGAGYQHYTNSFFCRVDSFPFYIGLVLPIMVIFIFNWVMYFIIIASVFHRLRNAAKVTNTDVSGKKLAWTAAVLSVVFGLGWGFGLAQTSVPDGSSEAAGVIVFILQLLFACLVGSQGILIFLFYGIGNKKVRAVWKKIFIHKNRKASINLFTTPNSHISARTTSSKPVVLQSCTIDSSNHEIDVEQISSFINTNIKMENSTVQTHPDKITTHQENVDRETIHMCNFSNMEEESSSDN